MKLWVVWERSRMILLHGFIKKDQKTPKKDLELALKRNANVKGGE